MEGEQQLDNFGSSCYCCLRREERGAGLAIGGSALSAFTRLFVFVPFGLVLGLVLAVGLVLVLITVVLILIG